MHLCTRQQREKMLNYFQLSCAPSQSPVNSTGQGSRGEASCNQRVIHSHLNLKYFIKRGVEKEKRRRQTSSSYVYKHLHSMCSLLEKGVTAQAGVNYILKYNYLLTLETSPTDRVINNNLFNSSHLLHLEASSSTAQTDQLFFYS